MKSPDRSFAENDVYVQQFFASDYNYWKLHDHISVCKWCAGLNPSFGLISMYIADELNCREMITLLAGLIRVWMGHQSSKLDLGEIL